MVDTCKVRIIRAQGHGPNSIFPHEQAFCEVWLGKDVFNKATTQHASSTGPLVWDEVLNLKSEATAEETTLLTLSIKGVLQGHQGVDEIGTGSCAINKVRST